MIEIKERKMKSHINGYKIQKQEINSNQFTGDKVIYWWERDEYIKCDGYSPLGYYAVGSGKDLEQAVDELLCWFTNLDKDDTMKDGTVQDLRDGLAHLNSDSQIKIKTDCGVLLIDSIDDTNDTIYINTFYK